MPFGGGGIGYDYRCQLQDNIFDPYCPNNNQWVYLGDELNLKTEKVNNAEKDLFIFRNLEKIKVLLGFIPYEIVYEIFKHSIDKLLLSDIERVFIFSQKLLPPIKVPKMDNKEIEEKIIELNKKSDNQPKEVEVEENEEEEEEYQEPFFINVNLIKDYLCFNPDDFINPECHEN